MRIARFFILLLLSVCGPTLSSAVGDLPTIAEKTKGMVQHDGYLPFYWDAAEGKVWLEIGRFNEEFLYMSSLPAGIGSNDIGLDRGQLGGRHVVSFFRSGPKVLLIEHNYDYRAVSPNDAERKSVRDAFATSVLAGFSVAAEGDGTVLVDATSFLLSDAHGVIRTLSRSGQGTYTLDPGRSAFYEPMMRGFPQNTEIEVMLTFSGKDPGRWVRSVTPTPEAVTVRERHSFVQLPDNGYSPRRFDPRGGFFGIQFADYATPIGEPLVQRFIARHRLRKKDPGAPMSDAVEPIVYYVDPGTPEPLRSALVEGARWWDQAFQAAGYTNAFQVRILPDDADPLDVRYNVIQWVHRSTRGWSYGDAVTDPRTGEIIKGHVSLGSLRARQDYLIAEGLLSPYETGKPASPEMEKMALARLRQLAAHEVGHTLGLGHNYIASSYDRGSVMDYPHPYALLRKDGSIDLSDAYDTGIGEWDKVAIEYGYRDYPAGTDADAASQGVLQYALTKGISFLTDEDARPQGSAHPATHLWDNGVNAVDELNRVMAVRKAALTRFSEAALPEGRPLATLEEVLVPLYLGHRYQVEAAAKSVAGVTYTYALRGDGQIPVAVVAGKEQRRALAAILETVSPEALAVPEMIISRIPPRPSGFAPHRELFASRTSPMFDRLAPARAAAQHTLSLLFNTDRANRLAQQHAVDAGLPGIEEILSAIIDGTWHVTAGEDISGEVTREVQTIALEHLLVLAADPDASVHVRAAATREAQKLQGWLGGMAKGKVSEQVKAHMAFAISRIDRFLEDPDEFKRGKSDEIPPGQPIGSWEEDDLSH